MVSEKLLPCPFCGNAGVIESHPSYSQAANNYDRHRGWCDTCDYGLDWHNYEADAIAAWNTRAPADLRSALEAETIERKALHEILRVRPPGDVETCKVPRKLVEQMERIAMAALAPTKERAA